MSIKNPEQDLYETIQFVREGKEEDSENPFAKKGKKSKKSKKDDDDEDVDESVGAIAGKVAVGAAAHVVGKIASKALEARKRRKKREAARDETDSRPTNESFDDDDNAIIEEIKNRVLAVLGEKVVGQEGEGQSGSGARRRANIPPTADSKFLELRKKRQQQTRQASPE